MFMQPEIMGPCAWILIGDPDTDPDGALWAPQEDCGEADCAAAWSDPTERVRLGAYGYRRSAPGYLDCTDWDIYATFAEAVDGAISDLDSDLEPGYVDLDAVAFLRHCANELEARREFDAAERVRLILSEVQDDDSNDQTPCGCAPCDAGED